jgi:glucosamine-phosphate N-acetyltransferase
MVEFYCLRDYVLDNPISVVKYNYLFLINELTDAPNMNNSDFLLAIENIHTIGRIIIGVSEGKIVCSGTIIIEPKIIHGGKSVGHIEDIVVLQSWRSKGIGSILIERLKTYGFDRNCYKIILDCNENLESFYSKNGLSKKGIQMAIYN